MMRVAALAIYPVKGLRAVPVASATLEPWGFADDRRFMVVDPAGRFLTQRDLPAMATIDAEREPSGLTLTCRGHPPLVVALPGDDAASLGVTVWRDHLDATLVDDRADRWLTTVLGRPCRLVFMRDPQSARPVDPDFGQRGDRVSFADGFPVLATTTASLRDLNTRLTEPVGMDRFRPNLVIDGAAPWMEDRWITLRIGDARLSVVKPCARCIVTTTEQAAGLRHPGQEPLRTLLSFRRGPSGQVLFGQNLVPRTCARIAVGDPVEIIEDTPRRASAAIDGNARS